MTISQVAIYARISPSARDGAFNKAESNQVEFLRRFANLRGWKVAKEYIDDGHRGDDPLRPALRRMKKAAALGGFDAILVWKVDRLARDTTQGYEFIMALHGAGVSLVSATEPIDTSSAVGRFILRHLLNFAEFEKELISERTKQGIEARRRTGGGRRGPDKKPRKRRKR